MTKRTFTPILLLCLTLTGILCRAQEVRGTILGRVTDAQGSVVPNAVVRVINTGTGIAVTLQTNEAGNYQAPYLLLGTYRVEAEAAGFKRVHREGLEVRLGDRLEINLQLPVGEVTETVNVEAPTPMLETASASMGTVVDSRRVSDLPLAHGNPYHLMQLAMGVAFTGNPALDRPFEPSHIANYAMDGARGLRNELSLDGVPNTSSTAGRNEIAAAFVPPNDVVGEVKIQTAAFDAAVGHTQGGVVSMSLKSGTNQLHGTAYYVKMAPELTANDYFANARGQARGEFTYNRWGASLNGPVILPKLYDGRNKTFVMYGYEGIHETRPRGGVFTVPTEAQRNGDFSALLRIGSNYQLYDPATRRAVAGGRFQSNPIPGNIVPASRISPIARNILKYYAAPNVAGTVDFRNNLSLPNAPEPITYYTHTWRLDHNLSDRHRVFGRANVYKRDSNYNNWFENAATGQWFQFLSRGASFDDVYTFSPSFIMNLRYGYNRFIRTFDANPLSYGFDLTSLGFPASWNNAIPPSVRRFPVINIGGYTSTYNGVLWRPNDTHAFVAAFDNIRGSHAIKFGMEYRVYRKNQVNPDNASTGTLTFADTYTRGPLDNSPGQPIGGGLASLLLGIPTGGGVDRRSTFAEQSTVWSFYGQDDWKITSRLILTLGLRYEIEGPLTERFDRTVRDFDPGAALPIEAQAKANYARNPTPEVPAAQFNVRGGLTFAGVNGLPRTLWQRDTNNFMPRIGIAYTLNPKTVFRVGYGAFFGLLGVSRGDVIQTGFSQTTNLIPTLDGGLTFVATLANPFPDGFREPVGSAEGAMTFVGQGISYIYSRPHSAKMQRWQFGIQRELPHRIMLEAAYVGNRGTDIETSRSLNGIPLQYLSTSPTRDQPKIDYLSTNLPNPYSPLLPGTGRAGTLIGRSSLLTAYPHFTGLGTFTGEGTSSYHSLQTKFDKRFSNGYTLQATWTWAKTMEASGFLNDADPAPYRQISDVDIPHRFSASGIWELPVGRGRALLTNASGFANALVGGWQVQGIYSYQMGQPLGWGNVIFTGDIKNIPLSRGERTVERWINTSAGFERDTRRALSFNLRTWPNRFAGIRGPGMNNWDASVLKNTKIGERFNVQIRGEFLNAWNHPMFNGPNLDPYNTAFGQITTTRGYQRRVQLGAKLIF